MERRMTFGIAGIILFGTVMFFGLHGAACNMHMIAAERYWARGGNPDKFKWSHAYCRAIGAPLRILLQRS